MPTFVLAALALPIAFLAAAGFTWNRLTGLRNRARAAFATIDVQLRRRYDLVPNLIATAKGALAHEKETLEALARARSTAVSAEAQAAALPGDAIALAALGTAETALVLGLGRVVALVERYPALKGDKAMTALMEELSSSENRIAFARQAYNTAVMRYENAREGFPGVLIAGPSGMGPLAYFRVDDAAERAPVKVTAS